MVSKKFAFSGFVIALLRLFGCAPNGDEYAKRWIAEMDARPPEERVPNWENTRAMMMRKPPAVGDKAPDFTLETRGGDETIRLSQFQTERPVVLIFGSWT